ncbi:S8 family serine peptidase [Sphingomonas sp. SUN039]|uniref:S8 family serine peptidase n=1 Tax=Sphingomonas sp. SUN039 TaxID=2937787 RepID=UPI002164B166|nr:S8 family serine peptidase [Sphingomonas sp. SUN039]UVO54154.1 S8 family serine peptidase [Sphingomonas sp. SUN039]
MKTTGILMAGLCALISGAAGAQLLPSLPGTGDVLRPVDRMIDRTVETGTRTVRDLADARLSRIAALVRANPGRIALDPDGYPARSGELVMGDVDDALLAAATAKGFAVIERSETLGVGYTRLAVPKGLTFKSAIRLLKALGAKDVSADQLYAGSGAVDTAPPPASGNGPRIGIIDGGVVGSTATQRGFASGAPRASRHGTAIASLIAGSGRVRGAAPGARLFVADVYGSDPAGGNATAIVKALGWLVGERIPVVTISLVGPPNPLLGRVIAAAQMRGTIVVAAVGNDGAASPPSYPASYPGVVAVTATDGRKRILIEAGRATHLDYAAPGADMLATDERGNASVVRGTSFAAPLVAATIARSYTTPDPARRAAALAGVDAAAERLGPRYGRGLVCGPCRTPPK